MEFANYAVNEPESVLLESGLIKSSLFMFVHLKFVDQELISH